MLLFLFKVIFFEKNMKKACTINKMVLYLQ